MGDLFWKSQFNEMKRTFSCHFGLFKEKASRPLLLTYFESRNSMKWKGLSAVILACFQARASRPLLLMYFESRNSMKWNGLSNVSLALFSTRSFLMFPWQARDDYWIFWQFTFKVKCSHSLREVLHGVGLPLPTLLQSDLACATSLVLRNFGEQS